MAGRPKKPITAEEIVAWAWYKTGTKQEKIAKQLNCDPKSVSNWARKIDRAISKYLDPDKLKKAVLAFYPLAIESIRYNLENKDVPTTLFFMKNVLGLADKQEHDLGGVLEVIIKEEKVEG